MRPRVRTVAALAGLLAACQATDRPAIVSKLEKGMEDHRRQINRDVSARKESLVTLTSALTGCPMERRTKDSSALGELLGGAAEGAASLYREGFPKDFELEADRISVRILAASGYDARALTELLRRMSAEPPARHAWVRTHPKFEERLETVGGRLALLGPAQPYPPPESVALRTQRFQQALQTLKAPAGQQAQR